MNVLAPENRAAPELGPAPAGRADRLWVVLSTICVVCALSLTFVLCLHPQAVTDFWWQARTGGLIVNSGAIPNRDPFSWTSAGQPWLVHEWLTEVFFYVALTRLPEWVLLLFKAGLATLACGLVLTRAWLRSGSLPVSVALAVLAGWVAQSYADLRPQMLSFVLLAALLLALDEYGQGRVRRLPWALPVVFAVWSNLHGGVVVGLALVVLWVLGETLGAWFWGQQSHALKPLWLGVAASLLTVALNPNGFGVYAYPFLVLGHPVVMDYISEWFSPNFHTPEMKPFLIMLLAALGALPQGRGSGRLRLGEGLVLAATGYAALVSQRNTVAFALCAAPPVAAALASALRDIRPLQPVFAGALSVKARAGGLLLLSGLLCALAFTQLPRTQPEGRKPGRLLSPRQWYDYAISADYFPHAAVAELARGRWPGKLYNDYVWGGYLIWKLYPARPVFIDGRAEVYYPTHTFEDEMTIHNVANGWEEALDRRGVEVVLTSRWGTLGQVLARSPVWRWEFTGPTELVYTRVRGDSALPPALLPPR